MSALMAQEVQDLLGTWDLSDRDLSGHRFVGEDLEAYVFRNANLTNVIFQDCTLTNIDVTGAIMDGTTMIDCLIAGIEFSASQLEAMNLQPIQQDFFAYCDRFPQEVRFVYQALQYGQLDGEDYHSCFVGIVAQIRCVSVNTLYHNGESPTEQLLFGIQRGDTPKDNPVAAKVAEWLREWIDAHQISYNKE